MIEESNLPLISVIMLSYNHEQFIEKAIKSVFRQKQYHSNLELIVIDDGSTDQTLKILNHLHSHSPITMNVIKKKHGGVTSIAKNMNELISLSKGSFVSMFASDDEYIGNRFQEQLAILEENENIQMVYGNGINVKDGKEVGNVNANNLVHFLSQNNATEIYKYIINSTSPLYMQSVLIRKSFLEKFTAYDEELIADDWVFNIRAFRILMQNHFEYRYINKNLFYRHVHSSNTSSNIDIHIERITQVIDKYVPFENQNKFYQKIYLSYGKQYLRKLRILKAFELFLKTLVLQIHL